MATGNGPFTPRDCAAAFVAAVAHKFAAEANAQISRVGAVTAIRYQTEITHPWPRAFQFTLELMAEDGSEAGAIDAAYKTMARHPNEECVINLLVPDPAALLENLGTLSYRVAWHSDLLAMQLQPPSPRDAAADVLKIVKVETPAQVGQTALLGTEQRSHDIALVDRNLHDFLGLLNGVPVARAQLVTTDAGIGYVSDMFTAPKHRRAGHAGALLRAMRETAYNLGMRHSVLAPSLMAHRFGVYERYGYRPCISKIVLFRAST